MLKSRTTRVRRQRGDTLIEVTFALGIMGMVLLGATSIVAAAFRTGQTARERTQLAEAAQEQMEALRTFRDNHTWAQFRQGGAGYNGIDDMTTTACQQASNASARCFHMTLATMGGQTDWVPTNGSMNSSVPTSMIEISTDTPSGSRQCAYDFELYYSFTPLGGSAQKSENHIKTRLSNLKYDGASPCP